MVVYGCCFTYASSTNSPDVTSALSPVGLCCRATRRARSRRHQSGTRQPAPGDLRSQRRTRRSATEVPLSIVERPQSDQDATEHRRPCYPPICLHKLSCHPNLLPAGSEPLVAPCSRTPWSWATSHQHYHTCPYLDAAFLSRVVGISPQHQSTWRLPSLLRTSWTS